MRWSILFLLAFASVASAQYPPQVSPKDKLASPTDKFPPQVVPKAFPPQVSPQYSNDDLIRRVDALIDKVQKHGDDIARVKATTSREPMVSTTALDDAWNKANKSKLPLVVFVGVAQRQVPGCVSVAVGDLNDNAQPRIVAARLVSENGTVLNATASDSEIRRAVGLEVSPLASPFDEQSNRWPEDAPPIADGDPWISREETEGLKVMWPKGVPFPTGLKFYQLPPVYQKMYTMNNGRSKFTDIAHRDEPHPWRVSGGMHHIDRKHWRNVTGLALTGPIRYWKEDTDVRAFALVPKHRWAFPKGTLAYDVLIRKDGNEEHIFEVRVQEKLDSGWDDGTVYRPQTGDAKESYKYRWDFVSEGLGAASTVRTVDRIPRKARFVPTKTVVSDDGGLIPPDYAGTGLSCNACHSRVGQLYDVPGQIYREARRGDDGRFSWHPFDSSGNIDYRWPIAK